jgi:purine-cytosine permease-like protein
VTAKRTAKDGLGILSFGAAACVACCAGPILAFLGGVTVAGIASTWLIGGLGLAISAVAVIGYFIVRRRQQRSACTTVPVEAVPVALTAKEPA